MTHDIWTTTLGLGAASFAIRLSGYLLARRLPKTGAWARGMEALPGCLIMALVALMMIKGGPLEWAAGATVLALAWRTKNLVLAMTAGIILVALLRLVAPL